MNIKNKFQYLGAKALLPLENGLRIEIKIIDYKNTYGRDRWLVTPTTGSGEAWVENVKFYDAKK